MFIFKRGNGYYYAVYDGDNGKRKQISTNTKSKSEALKFLTNLNGEIKRRKELGVVPINLKDFRFKILKRSELIHSYKTTGVYHNTFKFFLDYLGNINLHEITRTDVKNYLDTRIRDTSIYAARKDLICLKGAFKIAFEENHINVNPTIGIKQFKIPEKQPLYLSKDDYKKLEQVLTDSNFNDLIKLAVNTGMRQMELLTLKWKQINFNEKVIVLDNRSHVTKSKRIRTIPMNQNVIDLLIKRNESCNDVDSVFDYLQTASPSIISQRFKSYILKANINKQFHFHSLRHTFASWLVQNGVSIYYISKLLGHSNISTTEIYSHLRNEDLREATESLI